MDDTRPPGPEVTDRRGAHRGTGLRGQIRRELGVMFSRRHQPMPLRVAKWAAFLAVARGLRGTRWFRAWAFGLPAVGLGAHLFYRRMTRGWTEPWGGWNDADAARPRIERQDLGGKNRRSLKSATGRRPGPLCHRPRKAP